MRARARVSGDEWLAEGESRLTRRELTGARAALDRAEQLGAGRGRCGAGRWMVAMLAGDFQGAWRESDAIRRLGIPDADRFWMGESLAGKRVIVRCLHGLGDSVQMLRYAPTLRRGAASVVFEVSPAMLPLAMYFDGVEAAITWGEGAPAVAPEWDVQVEVMELPYLFRMGLEQLPVAREYLRVEAKAESRARPRVGIVWSSGEWDPMRSIPFSFLQSLLELRFVDWWSLQGGGGTSSQGGTCIREAATEGLVAMAEVVAGLDLLITVDTLAAHMAGAIGLPVWVMLQWAADWRWMTDREDSPWYPTMRLFRQPAPGDWTGVAGRVRAALVALYG